MEGLIAPQFQNEEAALAHIEKTRWPEGPVCPHCGVVNEAYRLTARPGSKKPVRKGVWKCRACDKQFSVLVDSIFSDSHIPLHKWLLAIHLMCSSKKGISAHQLMRNLEFGSYRTAWFMCHRIRWAMTQEPMAGMLNGIVEIDETYMGGRLQMRRRTMSEVDEQRPKQASSRSNKTPVVAVLQRGGKVHAFPVDRVTAENIKPIVKALVGEGTHIMTDSATVMKFPKTEYRHDSVNHSIKEYARRGTDGTVITTNTVEGFFALLKRGNYGVFHHWSPKYMGQYLREFEFRYNGRHESDGERAHLALKATAGKRLMLKEPRGIIG